jgi:threonine synthase
MKYTSTRGRSPAVSASAAIAAGIAPDGGLYVPEAWPVIDIAVLAAAPTLPELGWRFLRPFFQGDALEPDLEAICAEAFNFPAPVTPLGTASGTTAVLELYHGPTAAFKDFGARFLAACFARLPKTTAKTTASAADRKLTVLVATSGDTGGAVAAAFYRRPGIEVFVLYPRGLVSKRQQQQLTCWSDNVHAVAVRGTFDDCQRIVKEAFLDPALARTREFTSANSINIGRLLPQAVYFAAASLEIQRRHGMPASFIIPAGNLGNTLACVWARRLGLPVGRIVLAHNANHTVPDYLATGEYRPRPSVATLASAMDVGDPSNMERLRAFEPDWSRLRSEVTAHSVGDDEIRAQIRRDYSRYGRTWCPHTATAARVYDLLPEPNRAKNAWVIVATAHPAKFNEIVEPLTGKVIAMPPALADLMRLPSRSTEIGANLSEFAALLSQ